FAGCAALPLRSVEGTHASRRSRLASERRRYSPQQGWRALGARACNHLRQPHARDDRAGVAGAMAADRHCRALEESTGTNPPWRHGQPSQLHHGDVRLGVGTRERAARRDLLRPGAERGERVERREFRRFPQCRIRPAGRCDRGRARPRQAPSVVAKAPGALCRGAAGAAALFPRPGLCLAEMARGGDADGARISLDLVGRDLAPCRGARCAMRSSGSPPSQPSPSRGEGREPDKRFERGGEMTRFILIRLLQAAAVLAVMSFVVYTLIGLMPGDPIDLMISSNPHLTAADAARLKALYGLDRPLIERYFAWAQAALTGDFGYSRLYLRPTLEVLLPRLGNTAVLMAASLVCAYGLALPLGIAAARKPGSMLDGAVNLLCFAGISVPSFWLALMLILVFAASLGLFPAGGIATIGDGGFADRLHH